MQKCYFEKYIKTRIFLEKFKLAWQGVPVRTLMLSVLMLKISIGAKVSYSACNSM